MLMVESGVRSMITAPVTPAHLAMLAAVEISKKGTVDSPMIRSINIMMSNG
jgi:hypothetical protein